VTLLGRIGAWVAEYVGDFKMTLPQHSKEVLLAHNAIPHTSAKLVMIQIILDNAMRSHDTQEGFIPYHLSKFGVPFFRCTQQL
jgi:hypothetical protein